MTGDKTVEVKMECEFSGRRIPCRAIVDGEAVTIQLLEPLNNTTEPMEFGAARLHSREERSGPVTQQVERPMIPSAFRKGDEVPDWIITRTPSHDLSVWGSLTFVADVELVEGEVEGEPGYIFRRADLAEPVGTVMALRDTTDYVIESALDRPLAVGDQLFYPAGSGRGGDVTFNTMQPR